MTKKSVAEIVLIDKYTGSITSDLGHFKNAKWPEEYTMIDFEDSVEGFATFNGNKITNNGFKSAECLNRIWLAAIRSVLWHETSVAKGIIHVTFTPFHAGGSALVDTASQRAMVVRPAAGREFVNFDLRVQISHGGSSVGTVDMSRMALLEWVERSSAEFSDRLLTIMDKAALPGVLDSHFTLMNRLCSRVS